MPPLSLNNNENVNRFVACVPGFSCLNIKEVCWTREVNVFTKGLSKTCELGSDKDTRVSFKGLSHRRLPTDHSKTAAGKSGSICSCGEVFETSQQCYCSFREAVKTFLQYLEDRHN